MKKKRDGDRYFMSGVRIGPKGQIVIPKEAREMFGLQAGDLLVLLADQTKGMALQTLDRLEPMLQEMFQSIPEEKDPTEEEFPS